MVVIFIFIMFMMIVIVLGLCVAYVLIKFAAHLLEFIFIGSAKLLIGDEKEKSAEQVHREQY